MRSKRVCIMLVIGLLFSSLSLRLRAIAEDTDIGYISFSSNRAGNYDIYMIDMHGDNLRRLIDQPANELHPAWSPDGRFLAYASDENGSYDIYVRDMRSKRYWQLTNHPATDTTPTWSPDGAWIAFISDRTGTYNLYRMDTNGEKRMRLTNRGNAWGPAWSPDGEWIAFNSLQGKLPVPGLYVMSAEGGNPEWLARAAGQGRKPAWSPDSKQLAFTTSDFAAGDNVATIDLDGQNLRLVTLGGVGFAELVTQKHSPAWSPDGRWIAYVSENLEFELQLKSSIYLVDVAGEEHADSIPVTTHLSRNMSPAWVPEAFLSVSPGAEKVATLWGNLKKP